MNALVHIAASFYRFLSEHNIDPNKVHSVLRADDDQTLYSIEGALKHTWPKDWPAPEEMKNLKVHGIKISLASLDRSR